MIELNGKYNNAKVFTDNIDAATIGQVIALLNQESMKDSQIRIMPDTHAGKGCVIGTTMTLKDKVVPNLVGVDIGCFSGDTEVWCSKGVYKSIKSLAEMNETFLTDAYDEESGEFVNALATAFKTKENAELVEVIYGPHNFVGKRPDVKIKCTPDHRFLTVANGMEQQTDYLHCTLKWEDAKDLKPGMQLVANDEIIVVKEVNPLDKKEDVYCLNVPDYHNFSIKYGVIVHNCGMLTIKLKEKRLDLPKLDSVIHKYIPSGKNVHEEMKNSSTFDINELRAYQHGAKLDSTRAYQSIGTLGGGNHFLEVDKDDDGNLYFVIHTGSRNLGKQVAEYYQDIAYNKIKSFHNQQKQKEERDALIAKLKSEGREKEISYELGKRFGKKASNEKPGIPYELAYLEGEDFDDYIHDMKLVQMYAKENRAEIARLILKHAKLTEIDRFETIHNYIDTDNMILRKGAISCQEGEMVIIPINMRDGSLICIGKGNQDWNYSGPHGAGRLFSRAVAKEKFTVSEFKKTMKDAGIYTTSVNASTLDESPMAYKPIDEIIANVEPSVEIIKVIKPIYNFKAGED